MGRRQEEWARVFNRGVKAGAGRLSAVVRDGARGWGLGVRARGLPRGVPRGTERPETSPLVGLFADWEKRVRGALLAHWREKAGRLVERLRQEVKSGEVGRILRQAQDAQGQAQDAQGRAQDARGEVKAAPVLEDGEWWEAWVGDYVGVLLGFEEEAGRMGAEAGMELLETTWALGVEAEAVFPEVADWARRYAGELAEQLTETDRLSLRRHLAAWVESHEDFPALVERVESFLDNAPRARRIAVTEATRAYAEGNLTAWRVSEVVTGKVWNTANDELVCPICRPLNGQLAELDGQEWQHLRKAELNVGMTVAAPPAHVNCRCWLAPWVGEVESLRALRGR